MITFCQSYIFADKVSGYMQLLSGQTSGLGRGVHPCYLSKFFPLSARYLFISFTTSEDIGSSRVLFPFPWSLIVGSLSERYIANQYVAYLLCPCTGIIEQCQ